MVEAGVTHSSLPLTGMITLFAEQYASPRWRDGGMTREEEKSGVCGPRALFNAM